jgi:hypothetical protein
MYPLSGFTKIFTSGNTTRSVPISGQRTFGSSKYMQHALYAHRKITDFEAPFFILHGMISTVSSTMMHDKQLSCHLGSRVASTFSVKESLFCLGPSPLLAPQSHVRDVAARCKWPRSLPRPLPFHLIPGKSPPPVRNCPSFSR